MKHLLLITLALLGILQARSATQPNIVPATSLPLGSDLLSALLSTHPVDAIPGTLPCSYSPSRVLLQIHRSTLRYIQ